MRTVSATPRLRLSTSHPSSPSADRQIADSSSAPRSFLRWVVGAGLAVLAVTALTGCGSGSTASPARTSPPRPVEASDGPTAATVAPGAAVEAAYRQAMAAFDEATAGAADPNYPALVATMADPALSAVRNTVAAWSGFGQALRYPEASQHRIAILDTALDGDTAVLEVCTVDDGILYEVTGGRILNDSVSTTLARATLVWTDQRWRLSEREPLERWEGVGGCAAFS
jgi:hypothetical protein